MADLCDNELLISGSRIEMIKFYNCMGENIPEKIMDMEEEFEDYLEDNNLPSEDFESYIYDTPKIISKSQDVICLKYSTDWSPNNHFVVYLSKVFPNLEFLLEYSCAYVQGAGRYVIINGNEESDELCYDQIYLGRDNINSKYKFSNCVEDILEFKHTRFVDVIDNDWEKALKLRNIFKKDIQNFEAVEAFLNLMFSDFNNN